MDRLAPPVEARRVLVDRMAELRAQAFVPPDRVGGEVPVPDRFVGGAAEEREALLALAHQLAQLRAEQGDLLLLHVERLPQARVLDDQIFRSAAGRSGGSVGHHARESAMSIDDCSPARKQKPRESTTRVGSGVNTPFSR